MRYTKSVAAAISCVLALVATAGCTSSKSKDAKSSSVKPTGSVSVPTIASPTLTQIPLPSGSVPNDTSGVKRKDVAIGSCAAIEGGWQATGTAKNGGSSSETYVITIYFNATGNTVITQARTTVKVGAGKTENWTASAKFAAPKDVTCVLRGVG